MNTDTNSDTARLLEEIKRLKKEQEIEASLERVRNRAMAMQNSTELADLVAALFQELNQLDFALTRCYIYIIDPDTLALRAWTFNREIGQLPESYYIQFLDLPYYEALIRAWKARNRKFVYELAGEEKKETDRVLFSDTEYSRLPESVKSGMKAPERVFLSYSFNNFGGLQTGSLEPLSDKNLDILSRFGNVFDLTYTRFNDLQKAEAQARESQIEAALERIRSKALAMQTSDDLHGVSMALREQMGNLGQPDLESSIVHLYNSPKTLESWYTFRSTETQSNKVVTDVATIPTDSCDYIKETLEKYHSDETEYTIVSKGKKLADWYNVMVKVAPDTIEYDDSGKILIPEILYYHHAKFIGGALLMISNEQPADEAKELLRRAAKVFNLAYQRFLDLQQAEARAKEITKQAALDRVRAETAGMRTTKDLERITPLIWKELKTLEVPFFRCGVFIMNEQTQTAKVYLSDPSGATLAVWESEFDKIPMIKASVANWRKQKIYREEWDRKQFITLTKSLKDQNLIKDPKHYQGGEEAPEHLSLLLAPFAQGMLYVGSKSPQGKEQTELIQSLAEAFSVAYARYEDFNELEKAKAHIENALSELKSTQSQLIQAEKMASLGELTAGIAHEIQNPLNFVNNFSDVSVDLLEELEEETALGNDEEVLKIKEDIKQNLEKIRHHGRRASDIVRGMLEHSRSGDGKKEPADINTLADEYLRLAYHGLRAKDKSFNADFKTDFDPELPKINIVPQDIGRVLLNLINNAFYAVNEKAKKDIEGYVPTVIIKTKKIDKFMEIRVSDNGNGIPKTLLDKIFQPFYTTKPTGIGTGLGLSISYDIITKGHNGTLKTVTEEGVGTEFIIRIPE